VDALHQHRPRDVSLAAQRFLAADERVDLVRQRGDLLLALLAAGMDLATLGRIRFSTQTLANREIIPVPLFGLFKRWLPFKRVMVERAREMLAT